MQFIFKSQKLMYQLSKLYSVYQVHTYPSPGGYCTNPQIHHLASTNIGTNPMYTHTHTHIGYLLSAKGMAPSTTNTRNNALIRSILIPNHRLVATYKCQALVCSLRQMCEYNGLRAVKDKKTTLAEYTITIITKCF